MRGTVNRRPVGAASGALVVLACLASSGCTGGPDDNVTAPTFAPAPSEQEPSATPSAEPSASEPDPTGQALVPPQLPQAATQQTPEGAAAFASWWFDTLNYATATGDTAALRASTEMSVCETCEALITRVEAAYSSGGGIVGGLVRTSVEAPQTVDEGVATFVVRVDAEGASVHANGETEELPPGETVATVAAFWRDGWVMGDIAG